MGMWDRDKFSFLNFESFVSLRQHLNKYLRPVDLFLLLAKTKCRICLNLKCGGLFIKVLFSPPEYSISTPYFSLP